MNCKLDIDQRGVATLILNRPEVHNAFNDEMIKELTTFLVDLADNENVKMVVITGVGKSFCAGADLKWMKRMKDFTYQENLDDAKKLADFFYLMNNFKKPIIGKISGHAMGGGVGLLCCCDYVIAVETANFGLTEVRLGLLPAVISPYVVAKIGESFARATFISGARFGVDKAVLMGMVHQVSSIDKLDEDLEIVINDFLQAAPKASILAKELIFEIKKDKSDQDILNYTLEMIAKARASSEGQEGMNALLEKRKASWL